MAELAVLSCLPIHSNLPLSWAEPKTWSPRLQSCLRNIWKGKYIFKALSGSPPGSLPLVHRPPASLSLAGRRLGQPAVCAWLLRGWVASSGNPAWCRGNVPRLLWGSFQPPLPQGSPLPNPVLLILSGEVGSQRRRFQPVRREIAEKPSC